MRGIIVQPEEVIGEFVRQRLDLPEGLGWGEYRAIGLYDSRTENIVAGVIYNHFTGVDLCMNVAAEKNGHWMTPEFLFAAFDYPFRCLGMRRVTGFIDEENERSRAFVRSLGFTLEGRMRKGSRSGRSLCMYGMLKEECKWITEDFAERLKMRQAMRSGESLATV